MKKYIKYNFATNLETRKAVKYLRENKINMSHLIRESIIKEARELKKYRKKYPEGF